MRFFKKLVLIVIMVAINGSVLAKEQNTSQSDKDKTQIAQLFKHYMSKYNHFIATEELKILPALYDEQVMLITTKGISNTLSSEAMDKGVAAFLTSLKNKGVRRVTWENVEVKLLADHIALASNVAIRYLENGDIYNKVGATYLLNKSTNGWKISAFAVHAPENSIKLSDDG